MFPERLRVNSRLRARNEERLLTLEQKPRRASVPWRPRLRPCVVVQETAQIESGMWMPRPVEYHSGHG
jgi:hypothetical protein